MPRRRGGDDSRGRLADSWSIAKFHEHYPGLYHKWGRGWRETTDGTVAHKHFLVLLACVDAVEAGDELRSTRAVALGYALVKADKESRTKVDNANRRLIERAYPERRD